MNFELKMTIKFIPSTLCKEDTLIRLLPLTHQLLSVSRSKDSLVQEPLLGESLQPMSIHPASS